MDYRWKVPVLKPDFVDPQNTRATAANPQAPFQPGGPSQSPQDFLTGVANQADRTEKIAKLGELKAQLASIDAEIAKMKASPVTRENEMAIAAKLAEIGDTSIYQGILTREQNQDAQRKSSASSIDNMLYEADKYTFGLDSKSEEERNAVRQTIRASLDHAEEIAKRTGTQLPEKYYALRDKLKGSDEASIVYESERKRANEWWAKARNKTLTDKDIAEVRDFIEEHPDSDAATRLRPLVEQYAPQTVEAKARASKRKDNARDLYYSLRRLPVEEATRRIANLTSYERKLLEDFYPAMLK